MYSALGEPAPVRARQLIIIIIIITIIITIIIIIIVTIIVTVYSNKP